MASNGAAKHIRDVHWVNRQIAFRFIEPLALAALSLIALDIWSRLAPAVQVRTKVKRIQKWLDAL